MTKLALCISGGLLAIALGLNPAAALAGGGIGYAAPGYGYAPMPAPYGMPGRMYGVPYGYGAPPLPRQAPGYGMPARPAVPPKPGAAAKAVAPAPADPAAKPDPAEGAASAVVNIAQMRFTPARLTVKKGATVTWQQADRMPHTVTATDGSFSSPRLAANGEYSRTFDETGTFAYYCGLHPSMRGEIEVVD